MVVSDVTHTSIHTSTFQQDTCLRETGRGDTDANGFSVQSDFSMYSKYFFKLNLDTNLISGYYSLHTIKSHLFISSSAL